ncbi:MAG TPA: MBL fold metallo-hydrolase [Thermoanaerobaculia bacterium]|jgi:glyoxylase-like metal-dependent hydrolase (beta-lactamase superfamily II)/rhodanese-related sulfurtransferase|nr:MBL fold metallo-hydrolase [Thermoanaerobaculia bacterium]
MALTFQPFYLACLAHGSYLIGDGGECAIVDPQRDVAQYIDEAAKLGMSIRYVIETHLHADFVSGHIELANRTGAEIVMGAQAGATFPHRAVHDGDTLPLGGIELRIMETPGHTPESISIVVVENGAPTKVLTGDTLFIGEVGRPDLAGGRGFTSEGMAAMLYDSLHDKLLALPDDVEVWPAHGAGSACGKNISKERSSTIGVQRRTNYALAPMPRDEFVKMLTTDIAPPPPYFAKDAAINRGGARPLAEVHAPHLTPSAAIAFIEEGGIAIDVRDPLYFGASHIPTSLNIGLGGQFASWAGTLLSFDDRLVVIAEDEERANEAVMRLARVGLENVIGWIAFNEWPFKTRSLAQITPSQLRDERQQMHVLDVRGPGEYASGHVPGAQLVPLNELAKRMTEIEDTLPLAVICASGYRSSIAASLLERSGREAVINVIGGTGAWRRDGFDVESA